MSPMAETVNIVEPMPAKALNTTMCQYSCEMATRSRGHGHCKKSAKIDPAGSKPIDKASGTRRKDQTASGENGYHHACRGHRNIEADHELRKQRRDQPVAQSNKEAAETIIQISRGIFLRLPSASIGSAEFSLFVIATNTIVRRSALK